MVQKLLYLHSRLGSEDAPSKVCTKSGKRNEVRDTRKVVVRKDQRRKGYYTPRRAIGTWARLIIILFFLFNWLWICIERGGLSETEPKTYASPLEVAYKHVFEQSASLVRVPDIFERLRRVLAWVELFRGKFLRKRMIKLTSFSKNHLISSRMLSRNGCYSFIEEIDLLNVPHRWILRHHKLERKLVREWERRMSRTWDQNTFAVNEEPEIILFCVLLQLCEGDNLRFRHRKRWRGMLVREGEKREKACG